MTPFRRTPIGTGVRALIALHRAVFTASRGRIGGRLAGMPVVLLHTRGRRSGRERRTILTAPITSPERIVLIASKGGDPRHPAWFLNLREDPRVAVTTHGRRTLMRAVVLSGEDRSAAWDQAIAQYPDYAHYQSRTSREIPVVALHPQDTPRPG